MTLINRTLIIGANSNIVKKLDLGSSIDTVSHSNISNINFYDYSLVYLFSWSSRDNNANIDLINRIPEDKIVFVSTIAVLANQYRKQWAKYPNFKKICEDIVLAKGGRVLRLASVEISAIKNLQCDYAHTSPESLQDFLNSHKWLDKNRVVNLFTIHVKKNNGSKSHIFLSKINSLIPNYPLIQIPFIFLSKLFKSINYGYTYDCHRYIANEVMIGYGALGSVYDESHSNKFRKFIISCMPNKFLDFNGFKSSIIGKKGIGLSAYWHGVLTEQIAGTNKVKKDVLLMIKRPYPERCRSQYLDVLSIKHCGLWWSIQSISIDGRIFHHFANRIILAAGPLENIRLLSGNKKLSCSLDDDENAFIGFASLEKCLNLGLVKKFGFFIKNSYGLRLREDFFIEVRPSLTYKDYSENRNGIFYTSTTFQIIFKLLQRFSFKRFNEAFFNKFGIGLPTKELSIFCQALKKNAISISCNDSVVTSITRERFSEDYWREIQSIVNGVIPCFRETWPIDSFDGLHIQGGWNQELSDIKMNFPDSSLLILGSPSSGRNNPFHTTRNMQKEIVRLPTI